MKRDLCARKVPIYDVLQPSEKMLHRVTHTIMQNIMKIFHRAMKIRKYLRLSKNSLILSPRNQEEKLLI